MDVHTDRVSDREVKDRELIEQLEEEIRQLRQLLMPAFVPPQEWELTAQETDVLRMLATRPYVTYEMTSGVLDISKQTLAVVMSKMRHKLPSEILIKNERDRGWYLEPWDKEFIMRSASQWIKDHELEISDHLNLLRVIEMIANVDVNKLSRVVKLIYHVQKIIKT